MWSVLLKSGLRKKLSCARAERPPRCTHHPSLGNPCEGSPSDCCIQALAQACVFSLPFFVSMSAMAIFQQLGYATRVRSS